VFFPDKLGEQVAVLEQAGGVGAVFSHARAMDEEGHLLPDHSYPFPGIFREQNRSKEEWLRRFFRKGNCLCAPSALIRRSVIDVIGSHDIRLYQLQDFDYWVRLCLVTDIHIVQRPLLAYRMSRRSCNLSGAQPDKAIRTLWEWQKILRHYLRIEDRQCFFSIFPESKEIDGCDGLPLQCLLALVASSPEGCAAARLFGIDLLFDILGSKEGRQALDRSGFGLIDFFKLVGSSENDRRKALWTLGVASPNDSLAMRLRSNRIFRRLRGATHKWWPPT
jgi:hypothetical protein